MEDSKVEDDEGEQGELGGSRGSWRGSWRESRGSWGSRWNSLASVRCQAVWWRSWWTVGEQGREEEQGGEEDP